MKGICKNHLILHQFSPFFFHIQKDFRISALFYPSHIPYLQAKSSSTKKLFKKLFTAYISTIYKDKVSENKGTKQTNFNPNFGRMTWSLRQLFWISIVLFFLWISQQYFISCMYLFHQHLIYGTSWEGLAKGR